MAAAEPARGPAVVLVGAFDTKPEPLALLREELIRHGCRVHRVDFATTRHRTACEITADVVARSAGTTVDAAHAGGRASAVETMGLGVRRVLLDLHAAGDLDAVLLCGGSGAGTVFAAAVTALPFGVTKVLVSTVVAGDTRPYLQGLDALLFHPVVDIEGDNDLLRDVLRRAASATAASARESALAAERSRVGGTRDDGATAVAITMFGITTPCVSAARHLLDERGAQTLAFHANGTGGATLERLVTEGRFAAVLDLTTTELADLVAGGTLSAGEDRLTAAARAGVPQVVAPGALDTVNFGPPQSVPERFRDRLLHAHNPYVTLMRTDEAENAALGRLVAERVSTAPATSTVVLPMGGFSELDRPGGPFWWPEADRAFRDALVAGLHPGVRLVESDLHVNDPALARLLVDELARFGVPA